MSSALGFAYLADLVATCYAHAAPKRAGTRSHAKRTVTDFFREWRESLKSQTLPSGSGAILFRLLFPELDVRRRFGLKETLLSRRLVRVLSLTEAKGSHSSSSLALSHWNHADGVERTGFLGLEVATILQTRGRLRRTTLTLHEVDLLLDELAGHCSFSQLAPDSRPLRSQNAILHDLYDSLGPMEAAIMTQIILKDLRPLLYPLPTCSTSVALLDYNTASYKELDVHSAMKIWHWAMPAIYRVRADLDRAALLTEALPSEQPLTDTALRLALTDVTSPELGVPIEIPRSVKGRGCEHAMEHFDEGSTLYAETKYDGERMQIHIDMSLSEARQITIFSKSKRNSTMDRHLALPIVRAALGLPPSRQPCSSLLASRASPVRSKIRNAIVEAELVAYSESGQVTDEFHTVGRLLQRPNGYQLGREGPDASSQSTSQTSTSSRDARGEAMIPQDCHLAVVFFDVLYVDGKSWLHEPYHRRRRQLESMIVPVRGFSMLAAASSLQIDDLAIEKLQIRFGACIQAREEGLFLKPAMSLYNDPRRGQQWLKLKKDYIPGMGDTGSFCVIGGMWDKKRGRELGVGPEILTTWFIGLQTNRRQCGVDPALKPHYLVLFVSHAYGLARQQVEHLNFVVKGKEGFTLDQWMALPRLARYTFSFARGLTLRPCRVLVSPVVFELYGAGWTKSGSSRYYELRWPRVIKAHFDRAPEEALTLEETQEIAKKAVSDTVDAARSDAESAWDSACEGFDPGQDLITLSPQSLLKPESGGGLAATTDRESNSQISSDAVRRVQLPTPPSSDHETDFEHFSGSIPNEIEVGLPPTPPPSSGTLQAPGPSTPFVDAARIVLEQILGSLPSSSPRQQPIFWAMDSRIDPHRRRDLILRSGKAVARLSCLSSLLYVARCRTPPPHACIVFVDSANDVANSSTEVSMQPSSARCVLLMSILALDPAEPVGQKHLFGFLT